ncbi:MAG: CGGC domain-containing protein [Clostridia bacterium]|nr:CGGC domain-containing protein [Clostridia bacterium]
MRKIAIAACLQANDVCAGCGCLNAFIDRTRHFSRYAGEEIRLVAFMRCSHCLKDGGDPMEDAGFAEKLQRLVDEGVATVHISVCAGRDAASACPGMAKMARAFAARGLEVVWGTH